MSIRVKFRLFAELKFPKVSFFSNHLFLNFDHTGGVKNPLYVMRERVYLLQRTVDVCYLLDSEAWNPSPCRLHWLEVNPFWKAKKVFQRWKKIYEKVIWNAFSLAGDCQMGLCVKAFTSFYMSTKNYVC